MKKIHFILLLAFTSICISFTDHKYYSSISTIELNSEEKIAKIHMQVFSDDLFKLFEERFSESPNDFNKLSPQQTKKLQAYLSSKIKLSINRKPISLNFLGLEEEKNLTHFYLEGKIQKNPQRIEVSNNVLQDIFSEQINIVHVKHEKTTKSVHLTYAKNKAVVFFDKTTKH